MVSADSDLDAQQEYLAATSYDLRITNLARFIHSKITNYELRITNNTKSTSAQKLLDVGAGNGLLLKFFKSKGFQVSGYELEEKNVANMKKDPFLANENIRQGNILRLSGKEDYDIVIASDVIEHIKDDILAIRNLWSFVKPGGLLVITVPAHQFLYGKRDQKWGHYRRYDKKSLTYNAKRVLRIGGRVTSGKIEFATYWNIVGFFVYFLFEKIFHKPINENIRYSNSLPSLFVKKILDLILRIEEKIGGSPLGLTLIIGVRK